MDFQTTADQIKSLINAGLASISIQCPHPSFFRFFTDQISRNTSKYLVYVAPTNDAAEAISEELKTFQGNRAEILLFLSHEILPYDKLTYEMETTLSQMGSLFRLTQNIQNHCSVISAPFLQQRLIPKKVFSEAVTFFETGEEVSPQSILSTLVRCGFEKTAMVEDIGSFSSRGGILDCFPPYRKFPVRIEFFGDQIESIREFDPQSQRSREALNAFYLHPIREILFADENLPGIKEQIKALAKKRNFSPQQTNALLADIANRFYFYRIEALFPAFYPAPSTLFDYLPAQTVFVFDDYPETKKELDRAAERLDKAFTSGAEGDLVFEPEKYFLPLPALFNELQQRSSLVRTAYAIPESSILAAEFSPLASAQALAPESPQATAIEGKREVGEFSLKAAANTAITEAFIVHGKEITIKPFVLKVNALLRDGYRLFIISSSAAQIERLQGLISSYGTKSVKHLAGFDFDFEKLFRSYDNQVNIVSGDITKGFYSDELGLALISDTEIFGKRLKRKTASTINKKEFLANLKELKEGDYVVHVDHGVGLFKGLTTLKVAGITSDLIEIQYKGSDKLYLPIYKLNLIQRYIGIDGVAPALDKLGGVSFQKAKEKVKESILAMAGDLIGLYAKRQLYGGTSFSAPDEYFKKFEAEFPFEETGDQLKAITEVLSDMEKPECMDRLICGDVGYGKTEVAIRAAFLAILNAKQTCILVPTTILAEQHERTFKDRLKDYPVTVESISRFRTKKEQKDILARLKEGKIDIIIGTHRLFQNDIQFKNLGLLIIDEEHRFGVTHKERIKQLKAGVDVLSMSATPIPRTLHMSLIGLRDLSIIATPPVDRQAIKTFVASLEENIIREAILKELKRGGQVFFVHNRVQTIEKIAALVTGFVPEARVVFAHGQMSGAELEKRMLGFVKGESNVLVCTAIIESGLDIPRANTIIINNADQFGLAQLYQLRGRVGRSTSRAYCYLLINSANLLSYGAKQRLEVIQRFSQLGSGFSVSSYDLEIRGAGNLLGASQSGHIAAVGYELYASMMEEAIANLKGKPVEKILDPELKFHGNAFIPQAYIAETNQRILYYKHLSMVETEEEIDHIFEEVCDLYSTPPPEVLYLVELMRIKLFLRRINARGIEVSPDRTVIDLGFETRANPNTLLKLMKDSRHIRVSPEMKLILKIKGIELSGLNAITEMLKHISGK